MMRDQDLAGLAMTLSRDTGLTLTVGGEQSTCSSDGRHIHIAAMPATPLGRMLMTGLVFHEVGHKNHTRGPRPAGLLGEMTNILEDIRVEKATMAERPGTRFDLEGVATHYAGKGALDPFDAPTAVLGLALAYGRARVLKQVALEPLLESCRRKVGDAFGTATAHRLETLLEQKLPLLASTRQAENLAEKLLAVVADNRNQESVRRGDGEETQKELGQGADQEESVPMEGPRSEDREEDAEADTPAESADEGALDLNTLETTETGYGDLEKLMTAELNALASQVPQSRRDTLPHLPKVSRKKSTAPPLDEVEALCASSRMRARLLGLLQALRRSPVGYGTSGRKLASNRLARMALGDARIFRRRKETARVNTAVVVLLDASGSMYSDAGGRCRADIANPAAFALHHTLAGIEGVAVLSAAFHFRDAETPPVQLLVDFDEKPKSAAFNLTPDGGTPTADALWFARAALLQRSEPRRLILLLTDGYPNDPDATRAATARCHQDGIEIIALGLGTDAVRRYWPRHQVLHEVAELPQALFGAMEKVLVAGPFQDEGLFLPKCLKGA